MLHIALYSLTQPGTDPDFLDRPNPTWNRPRLPDCGSVGTPSRFGEGLLMLPLSKSQTSGPCQGPTMPLNPRLAKACHLYVDPTFPFLLPTLNGFSFHFWWSVWCGLGPNSNHWSMLIIAGSACFSNHIDLAQFQFLG